MIEVRQTKFFAAWLEALTDLRAAEHIARRIVRLPAGLLGDFKPVGGGVSEWRVDHGPGYRVYFVQRGRVLIIMLCSGDKRSQRRDIETARALAADLEDWTMATKTLPFDAARTLTSPEAQAELLSDAMESGGAAYIGNALGVIARARGMTEVARGAGVTREALYRALSEDGDPRLTTLLGVMKSLGLRLSVEAAR